MYRQGVGSVLGAMARLALDRRRDRSAERNDSVLVYIKDDQSQSRNVVFLKVRAKEMGMRRKRTWMSPGTLRRHGEAGRIVEVDWRCLADEQSDREGGGWSRW